MGGGGGGGCGCGMSLKDYKLFLFGRNDHSACVKTKSIPFLGGEEERKKKRFPQN